MSDQNLIKKNYRYIKLNYPGMIMKKKILGDFYTFDVICCYVPMPAENEVCSFILNVSETVKNFAET